MNKGKRIVSVVVALLMLFSLTTNHVLPASAEGEEASESQYPLYSKKSEIADADTVTDWGIATAADWLAAVTDSSGVTGAFEGKTLHLLNDVDMENQAMKPLAYSGTFAGTLDGHDYVFKNILIDEELSGATPIGLLASIAGTVKNLGIESGKINVNYTNTNNSYGVGSFAGEAKSGALIQRCWNGADVIVKTPGANGSVSGLIGRGLDGSTIDGCYNIGEVKNETRGRAAGLNDWGQSKGYAYNSFNAGKISINVSGSNQNGIYVLRYNNPTSAPYANIYGIGSDVSNKFNDTAWTLDSEAYINGELAYKLNIGYTEGKGTKTYYTLQDGKTVFGTAENQVVKLALTTKSSSGNVEDEKTVYVPAGSTYTLPTDAAYEITDAGDGFTNADIHEDGTFTVPAYDVAITVTLSGLSTAGLRAQLGKYENKETKYFQNSEELNALLESVRTKLENMSASQTPTYTTQEEVDADAARLEEAYVYVAAPNLPRVTEREKYSDAPGYMIMDAADMEAVGENAADFTAEQTLYLGADIDLTGSSFNGMDGLAADFDGMSHIVSHYTGTKGFFRLYAGSDIRGLTLTDSFITGGYAIAALVEQYKNELTIEDVAVRNTTVAKLEGDSTNAIAVLVSRCNGNKPITVRNCVVSDCILDITKSGASTSVSNIGMIMGQVNADNSVFDHNLSINNKVKSEISVSSVGLYLGESTGINVKVTNSAVWGGGFYNAEGAKIKDGGRRGSLVGAFRNTDASLTISNVLIHNTEYTGDVLRIGSVYSTLTMKNVYYEGTTVIERDTNSTSGTDSLTNVIQQESSAFLSGETMYLANHANDDTNTDWAIVMEEDESGQKKAMICFADSVNCAPVKVTFTAKDNSDGNFGYVKNYYTDNSGTMIGEDIAETIADADWGDSTLAADKAFGQDTEYTGYVMDIGAEVCYVSLSLDGNIGINYYVRLSDAVKSNDTAYMQFTVGEDDVRTVYVKDVLDHEKEVDGKPYYVFTCSVNSIQMGEIVKAQMIVDDSRKGPIEEYSVQRYAQSIINDASMSQETIALTKALLNYGGYAQKKYAQKTTPVNEILSAEEQILSEFTMSEEDYKSENTGSVEGITFYGSTLVLDSCTAIRHYFTLGEGAGIDEFTFTLRTSQGDVELEPVRKGDRYYVEIPDINAYELGNMYTVTVTGKSGETENKLTIYYGVMSYVKNMCGRDTTPANTKDMLKALYWYFMNAAAFIQAQL